MRHPSDRSPGTGTTNPYDSIRPSSVVEKGGRRCPRPCLTPLPSCARMRLLATIVALLPVTVARADSLDTVELKELRAYLAELKAGGPGSAASVERLAGVSFAGLI